MRRSARSTRMVQRTCLDCGETWTLDPSTAHRGRRGWRFTSARQAGLANIRGRTSDFAVDTYAAMDQLSEELRRSRTCPKCGSEHFKDQNV